MKSRFHLDAFSVQYDQPKKSGVYACIYANGEHNIGTYDADDKTWSGDVEAWIHPTPVRFSDSHIVENAGFRSKFRHLDDVMFEVKDRTFYGWIAEVNFPDENTPEYVIEVVVAWVGEPFNSEPITLSNSEIDPESANLRESDREIN